MTGELVQAVDVSDICRDVDEVAIFDDGPGAYHARPFVEEQSNVMDEVDVDLREYPAVVAVCRRAFDTREPVDFEPHSTYDPGGVV